MDHDDGQLPADLEEADVILVGISRTSKTPTSIYLANRGIKTANIPIVLGVPLPERLSQAVASTRGRADRHEPIGLRRSVRTGFSDRPRISMARTTRTGRRSPRSSKYARSLCARHNWPVIDVTRRSIEETAAAIVALRPKLR